MHCVKSVRIWSYSGPYFPAFGPELMIFITFFDFFFFDISFLQKVWCQHITDDFSIFFTFKLLSINSLTNLLSYIGIGLVFLETRRGPGVEFQVNLPKKNLPSKSPASLELTSYAFLYIYIYIYVYITKKCRI